MLNAAGQGDHGEGSRASARRRARKRRPKSGRSRSAPPRKRAKAARRRAARPDGRSGARRLRPRSAHAADRHSRDQRSACDLRTRRARAALGRHHQGRRRTSGEPCHAVRRCAPDRTAPDGLREDLFDLRALARSAGDSLAGRAAAKGLQAEIDISDRLPSLVVGDPVRLRAALENLIDNAVKFTDAGGVALSVVPARASKGKVGVAFAVSDSGIGFSCRRSSGCSVHSRRPMSRSPRASAAPVSACPRSSSWRARWAATSWSRRAGAAAPPSR